MRLYYSDQLSVTRKLHTENKVNITYILEVNQPDEMFTAELSKFCEAFVQFRFMQCSKVDFKNGRAGFGVMKRYVFKF